MSKKVYDDPEMMSTILDIKRYIDDGGGFQIGTEEEFQVWLAEVNRIFAPFGFHIDESCFKRNANYNNLLDIRYCFDEIGSLQTDLYTKETDSRAYLNFSSAHPKHTFSGNVYSQSLRLRRIINSDERLRVRLGELGDAFKKAGYPEKMVTNITTKVQNSERNISKKQESEKVDDEKIIVVSTFGADKSIVEAVRESEDTLKKTVSFRNQQGPLFKYVKKVGPSIRSHVNSVKKQALGIQKGHAKRCNGRGCKTCKMLIETPSVTIGDKKVNLTQGSCKTYNICYLAMCNICGKPYTGRTVGPLHTRNTGHRSCYNEILKRAENNTLGEIDTNNDMYMLGLHLHMEHGLTEPNAFNKNIKFGIIDIVTPADIEKKEYRWMHRLNTFQPVGINVEYPFGIPYLGQK